MRALARAACRGLGDPTTASGGTAAILLVAITHLTASLALAPNGHEDGCRISLPCLGAVVLWVGIVLGGTMGGGKFLPDDQRRRIRGICVEVLPLPSGSAETLRGPRPRLVPFI